MENTYQDLITDIQSKNPKISGKLEGGKKFKIIHFVFFVIAFFSLSGVNLKPSSSPHFINFGLPPASKTISG